MTSLVLFVVQIALLLVQVSVRDAGKRRKSESYVAEAVCCTFERSVDFE